MNPPSAHRQTNRLISTSAGNSAKTISRLDIGQSLAVLDKDVLAVEAIEGTNAMIDRAAQYCKTGGWTLIKCANAQQDMRLDVPTVGITTIEKLNEARAGLPCPGGGQDDHSRKAKGPGIGGSCEGFQLVDLLEGWRVNVILFQTRRFDSDPPIPGPFAFRE